MPATCKNFALGVTTRAHWDPEARVLTVLASAEGPTWERILTADDPAELVGLVAWRCALPGARPVVVGGVAYASIWAAAAAGAGLRCGPDLLASAATTVSGAGWSQIWAWDDAWSVTDAEPLPA